MASALDYPDPAQAHGMLCGMLCAAPNLDSRPWLAQLRSEIVAENLLTRELLLELFAATVSQMQDEELVFSLLLPDDGTDLRDRANALGCWSQGFLSGLGMAGLTEDSFLSPEGHEFLIDVNKFAQLGFETDEADEEEETAYAEIVEYLRIGTLLIYQEARSAQSDRVDSPSRSHSRLH
jgi:uncharacterized protein YgfB (UPF0149 family)